MKTRSLGTNAALNVIKQACAIIFPLISFTYSSHILGADQIGVYNYGKSIVSYFTLIAGLGISNYALREGAYVRDDKKKISLFIDQIFSINIVSTLISFSLLSILLVFNQSLGPYQTVILIQSISIILITAGADWINTIFEDYYYLAVRYVLIQIISFLALVLFVRRPEDLYIYAIISMLSSSGGNILNIFYLRRRGLAPRFTFNMDVKRHLKPLLILFGNSVASVIYLNSDITMLGAIRTDSEVGIYYAASNIYSLVKSLINAIVMVTVPRFSYWISNNKINEYTSKVNSILNALIFLAFPAVTGIIIEATNVLVVLSGAQYASGSQSLIILAFALIPAIGGCLYSYSILIPNKKEDIFLIATSAAATTNIILNFIFIPLWGIMGAAFTTLIAEIIVFSITLLSGIKIIRTKPEFYNVLSSLAGCVGIVSVCVFVHKRVESEVLELFISVIGSILIYAIIEILLRNPIALSGVKTLKHKISKITEDR